MQVSSDVPPGVDPGAYAAQSTTGGPQPPAARGPVAPTGGPGQVAPTGGSATGGPTTGGPRARQWCKRYMPADIDRVLRDYDSGMNAAAIADKYGVSKATLYRWIAQYGEEGPAQSPAHLRAQVASLEKTVLMLTAQLAAAQEHEVAP